MTAWHEPRMPTLGRAFPFPAAAAAAADEIGPVEDFDDFAIVGTIFEDGNQGIVQPLIIAQQGYDYRQSNHERMLRDRMCRRIVFGL